VWVPEHRLHPRQSREMLPTKTSLDAQARPTTSPRQISTAAGEATVGSGTRTLSASQPVRRRCLPRRSQRTIASSTSSRTSKITSRTTTPIMAITTSIMDTPITPTTRTTTPNSNSPRHRSTLVPAPSQALLGRAISFPSQSNLQIPLSSTTPARE
jgi:hypothetical protein